MSAIEVRALCQPPSPLICQKAVPGNSQDLPRDRFLLKIARFITENKLPFPRKSGISDEEAMKDFFLLKQKIVLGENFMMTGENLEPRYKSHTRSYNPNCNINNIFYDDIISRKLCFLGNAASDHCQYPARIHSRCRESDSPLEMWNSQNQALIVKLLHRLPLDPKNPTFVVKSDELAKAIAKSRLIPSQFPTGTLPAIVRLLRTYNDTPKHERWKILDPCSGWSNRLVGAMAAESMVSHYIGIDPNKSLAAGQSKAVEIFPSDVQVRHICKCFEDLEPSDMDPPLSFDLVMTSPPFFTKEFFCDSPTQSNARYIDKNANVEKNIHAWLNGFLFPMLTKAWNLLKIGGFLAIHLDDINEEKGGPYIIHLTDPMNKYIASKLSGRYLGAVGLSITDMQEGACGPLCEPIWIWQKVSIESRNS